MPIKALIFDFDGLIVDTESAELQAWQEVFDEYGMELSTEVWAELVGRPRAYFDMYAYFKELAPSPVDIHQLRVLRRGRVQQLILAQPVLPGVREALTEGMRRNLRIGLASSSGGTYVRGHLERLGLAECFHATRCFEDTSGHKPGPEPYLAVLDDLGVAAVDAIAFEDSPNGVAAAKAAGVFCVAVPNAVTRRLPFDNPDLTLESLAHTSLASLLERAERRSGAAS